MLALLAGYGVLLQQLREHDKRSTRTHKYTDRREDTWTAAAATTYNGYCAPLRGFIFAAT